jgi:hypothetical protein
MSSELKAAFADRLWALASLVELEPEAVAFAAGVVWEVDEDPPPPSRRHAWQRFAYAGLVREPFASVVLAWQPERRVGRVDVTPTRIISFSQAELDLALRERGAPKGEAGALPHLFGSAAPFASARVTEVVYVVGAGRLRVSFEAGALRNGEIAPPS